MASTTLVVPSRMKVNYNLEVLGNLIVKGNTTYLDTDVFRVDDAMIVLANNQTAANMDAGFMVQRGSSNNAVFYWDESSDTWTCATSSSNHDSVKPDAPDIGNSTNAGFTAALITASGRLITDDTTDASSKTDGALQTDGGLSVAKKIYSGTAVVLAADSGTVTMGAATAAVVTAAGIINVNNTTDAATTTDGSLQTDGGLSVAKSAVIGDDLDLLSDGAIFAMGAGQDVTITHDGTSGATLNSADDFLLSAGGTEVARIDVSATSLLMSAAKKIEFRDAALTVYSSADGQLDIDADTELEITTTTVDMNAACSISGITTIEDTTASSTAANGALIVKGGVGIAADLTVGDDIRLLSDSAVLALGAGNDVTITHDGATGATLNSAGDFLLSAGGTEVARIDVSAESVLMATNHKLEFRDTGLVIHSTADGQLDIDADTELEITTTTVDMNAACSISGITTIEDTTASSTAANGALIVKGGVGIAADLTVGDDIRLLSDSAVLALGAGNDVTITHDGATGATLNSAGDFLLSAGGTEVARVDVSATCILMAGTKQIRFSDDATYIQRNGATLRIENDTQNNAAAIDIRANTGGITLKAAGTTTGQVDIATANGTTKGSVKITPKAAYGHIDFSGTEATTSGASVFDIDSAGTMTMAKFVKIAVNDAVYYLPAYAAS